MISLMYCNDCHCFKKGMDHGESGTGTCLKLKRTITWQQWCILKEVGCGICAINTIQSQEIQDLDVRDKTLTIWDFEVEELTYGNNLQTKIDINEKVRNRKNPDLGHISPERRGCLTCLDPECPIWQTADQNCWKSGGCFSKEELFDLYIYIDACIDRCGKSDRGMKLLDKIEFLVNRRLE